MSRKRFQLILATSVFFAALLMSPPVSAEDEKRATGGDVAEVGKPAPRLKATGIDGKTITLADLNSDGHNVVLVFSRAHW